MTHDHIGNFSIDCIICLRERIAKLEEEKADQKLKDAVAAFKSFKEELSKKEPKP